MGKVKQMVDFLRPWGDVPTVWIDFETTGVVPGVDAVVEAGVVRFEHGTPVGRFHSLVNPHRTIPKEARDVHGITEEDVKGAPSIVSVFDMREVRELMAGAQPGAFNAWFDRMFMPPGVVPYDWPWLDPMVLHRMSWPYKKHTLAACCRQFEIDPGKAHSAASDAEAAGRLFYLIGHESFGVDKPIGDVLARTEFERAKQWHGFHKWVAEKERSAKDE